MNIFETVIGVEKGNAYNYQCKILGENVRSGARYGCEWNVLRDQEIRFVPTKKCFNDM